MDGRLVRALWRNSKEELTGKDADGNGYVDDVFGYDFAAHSAFALGDPGMPHGSACAGIIAGRPVPEKRLVTGVAPRAHIMMLRGMGYLKSYEYALANGADVISMSYMWVRVELGNYRGLFRMAHEHLAVGGVVAVGGAGNFAESAPKGKQICLPKDIPCVIAAAGIIENGTQPAFSSKGPCFWQGVKFYDDYPESAPLSKPDVTAPMGGFACWSRPDLVKLSPRFELVWKSADGSYGLVTGLQGNSFAGPHAAGVAALMLSANPELNSWQVKEIMEATCKALGEKGRDLSYGAGLLQALEAVRAAKKIKKH
jgi:subtilisin family serine protease